MTREVRFGRDVHARSRNVIGKNTLAVDSASRGRGGGGTELYPVIA